MCAGEALRKAEQLLGGGAPEAVDALILVAYEEKPLPFRGKELEQGMLGGGEILGFVHVDPGKAAADGFQKGWAAFQDLKGEKGHVIIVHELFRPLFRFVPCPDLREGRRSAQGDLLRGEKAVFGVTQSAFQFLQGFFVHESVGELPGCPAEQGRGRGGAAAAGEGGKRATGLAAEFPEEGEAEAVDGGKAGRFWEKLPEKFGKAAAHVGSGAAGKGQVQHFFRRDAGGGKGGGSCYQHGGLSGTGDG